MRRPRRGVSGDAHLVLIVDRDLDVRRPRPASGKYVGGRHRGMREHGAPYTTATFSCLCIFQAPGTLVQGPATEAGLVSNALATGG